MTGGGVFERFYVNSSELWVTLIFCVIMYLFGGELKQKKVTKILMLVCIARLVSDAVSWAFDGGPGLFWGVVTRCSNYMTFVTNDLVSLVFSVFLWNLVKKEGEKPSLILKAYWIAEAIAVTMLTLNLHFGCSSGITIGSAFLNNMSHDIRTPMMNGYEAAKRIRAMKAPFCRQIPIIAMTANAFEEDKALAPRAGMNDYLAKPIQIDKMRKVISSVLRDGQV